jgi:hypothetical protein
MDQEAPEILETLDTMRRGLAEVAALIRQATGADRARETRAVQRALVAAKRHLTAPSAHLPGDPAIVEAWLHEVRGSVNAMVGWGQVLALRAHDEATWLRALEAIERNAKLLRGWPIDPG